MRTNILLLILLALSLCGCGEITRAEYEQANPHLTPMPIGAGAEPGTTMVAYPDRDPRIDLVTHEYSAPEGVRVVIYNRDDVIVQRWFQENQPLKP